MSERNYPARFIRLIDADTYTVQIDHGYEIASTQTIRAYGINAPERNTPAGQAAITWAKTWFAQPTTGNWPGTLTSQTAKDKYGRRLADITINGRSYATDAITAGVAVPWDGHGTKPT